MVLKLGQSHYYQHQAPVVAMVASSHQRVARLACFSSVVEIPAKDCGDPVAVIGAVYEKQGVDEAMTPDCDPGA
jgi:hypothetical protein